MVNNLGKKIHFDLEQIIGANYKSIIPKLKDIGFELYTEVELNSKTHSKSNYLYWKEFCKIWKGVRDINIFYSKTENSLLVVTSSLFNKNIKEKYII